MHFVEQLQQRLKASSACSLYFSLHLLQNSLAFIKQCHSKKDFACFACSISETDYDLSRHLLNEPKPSGFPETPLPAGSRHAKCICISCAAQCKCLALVTGVLRGSSLRSTRCNPAQTMQIKGLLGRASMSLWMCSWSLKALGTSHFLWQEHPLMRERASYPTRESHLPVGIVLLYSSTTAVECSRNSMLPHQDCAFHNVCAVT